MYIIHEYEIEKLVKILLNIAHNKQLFRIPGDSLDEKEQNFNVFDGDLAVDNLYGNECYIYSSIPISPDALVSEIERFGKDVLSITSEANGEYTCLTKTGIRRYIYIDNPDAVKSAKPKGRGKVKEKTEREKLKKDTFIVNLRYLSVENLPDWIHKLTGSVISDEENLKQMLSIIIDTQGIFGRLPFRCTDTPLSYQLANSEYLVPHINIDGRFGVRLELMKLFCNYAGFTLPNYTQMNGHFGRKETMPTIIGPDGLAAINGVKLYRQGDIKTYNYRRDRSRPPENYMQFDSCMLCAVPLYGQYYALHLEEAHRILPFCATCGELDLERTLEGVSNDSLFYISEYPRTFNEIISLIPKFPYIPDHVFENYKRSLMWLNSQPFLNIRDERVVLENEFLKLVRPSEVFNQLRLAQQDRKFIIPVLFSN